MDFLAGFGFWGPSGPPKSKNNLKKSSEGHFQNKWGLFGLKRGLFSSKQGTSFVGGGPPDGIYRTCNLI